MNRTAAYIAIACVAIIGVAGVTLLIALDKDAGPVITMIGTLLAIIISAAVTIDGQKKLEVQNDKIKHLVNGNTSALISMVDPAALTPDQARKLDEIAAANDDLVAQKKGRYEA